MVNQNAKGQFVKGNKASPGRPKKAHEKAYLDATIAAVTVADWQKIIGTAVTDAIKGDARARNFLAKYLLGKPEDTLNIVDERDRVIRLVYSKDVKDNSGHSAE